MNGPGYNWRWALTHPLKAIRTAYRWQRAERGSGRFVSAALVPFNAVALTGALDRWGV